MLVVRFLDWVESAPVERRAEAVNLLARAWLYSDMEPVEAEAAEAALTAMLDDPSARVRRALADALCRDPRSPDHIILSLVQDTADIAEIVLAASPVLLDEDLVDIAATSSSRLQVAIASRPWIAAPLAAALAEIGSLEACLTLSGNIGAEMTSSTMRRLAERHGCDARLRSALCDRHDCPIDVRQMLLGKVTEALGGLGLVRATITEDRLSTIMREARDKATVTMSAEASEGDIAVLAEHLLDSEQLTPALLLRALCTGNVRLFEQALVTLSGMPARRVAAIVDDPHSRSFDALLHRAGLPASTHRAFQAGLDVYHRLDAQGEAGDVYGFARLMLERATQFNLEPGDSEVQKLLALLRRFAAESARDAVREMKLAPGLAVAA